MPRRSPDEKLMKPYLRKLLQEHKALNRKIDTSRAFGMQEQVKALKRLRLRLKDKIAALRRYYYGRSLSS